MTARALSIHSNLALFLLPDTTDLALLANSYRLHRGKRLDQKSAYAVCLSDVCSATRNERPSQWLYQTDYVSTVPAEIFFRYLLLLLLVLHLLAHTHLLLVCT